MKRLYAIVAILFMSGLHTLGQRPLREMMACIHDRFEVNFVYDSSIDMDRPCPDRADSLLRDTGTTLEEALQATFSDSGISWEVSGRYVVLKKPGAKKYTIYITEKRDTLKESIITSERRITGNTSSTGFRRFTRKAAENPWSFLSTSDVTGLLKNQSGVQMGTELLSGMYVHGGSGTSNLYLMDGVPLLQTGHLAGVISPYNSDVLEDIRFYKSGFPSRYGGRLSSVVDIRTSDGDMYSHKGTFSIGLIETRAQLEGPVVYGKSSFNVALRRSWLDALTIPAAAIISARTPTTLDVGYSMMDINAGLTHRFNRHNTLSFKTYWASDNLRYDNFYHDGISTEHYDFRLKWGNFLASANWESILSERIRADIRAYVAHGWSEFNNTGRSGGYGGKLLFAKSHEACGSDISTVGGNADMTVKVSETISSDFGVSVSHWKFSPEHDLRNISYMSDGTAALSESSEREEAAAKEASGYLSFSIMAAKWLSINAAVRGTVFGDKGMWHKSLEPRAALKFRFSENVSFDISYTKMTQFIHVLSSSYIGLPTDFSMPSNSLVTPSRSDEIAAELRWMPAQGWRLAAGGYAKKMKDIKENWSNHTFCSPVDGWEHSIISGEGKAAGAELEIAYRTGKTEVAVFYTLSWNLRHFNEIYPHRYPDAYDNRHKFTIWATHRFSECIDACLGWNYHSGNRLTLQGNAVKLEGGDFSILYSSPNNYRLPPYHRLDFGINFRKRTKNGNERIWNISIYNVYCRMNPVYATIEQRGNELKAITTGFVPILPSFSYTIRF